MDQELPTALRGFDSYEIRLGDELRGHRATMGKSLLDVQRELRIKASYIDAIENCDASVVPNKGFVPGYVRAYARYLGLDPDPIYARFCAESGFVGRTTQTARPGAAPRGGFRLGGGVGGAGRDSAARDPALSRSHFAAPVGRARPVGLGVSLSDMASVAVLLALIGGLGWGGWKLVEDIQRVEFAPAEEAPQAAQAPANVALPGLALQAAPSAWPGAGRDREAALAELYAPREPEPPAIALRDGPIAAIDPARSGLYADAVPDAGPAAPRIAAAGPPAPGPQRAAPAASPAGGAPAATAGTGEPPDAAGPARDAEPDGGVEVATADPDAALPGPDPADPVAAADARGVWLVVSDPAWVQVKARDGSVLMQRIMEAGERWQVPPDLPAPELRAGNAGGVYLQADGVLHGPLGPSGGVVKRIPLTPQAVAADWPLAD